MRLLVTVFAGVWGIVFFRSFADLAWGEAVVLAGLAASTYAVEPTTRFRRGALAGCTGLFMGLGAWWTVGVGLLSIPIGVLAAASLPLYGWLIERRG